MTRAIASPSPTDAPATVIDPPAVADSSSTAVAVGQALTEAGLSPRWLPDGGGVLCDLGTGERTIALHTRLPGPATPPPVSAGGRVRPGPACEGPGTMVSALLAAGLELAGLAERSALPGRVRLLFQPAEAAPTTDLAGTTGALEIIAAGGVKEVSAVIGIRHTDQLPVDTVGVHSGPISPAVDQVALRLTGPGGHTARPHLTADLVYALGQVLVDLPPLLARRAGGAAELMWSDAQAGEAYNAIPSTGSARGSVRVDNPAVWPGLPDLLDLLLGQVLAGTGAGARVHYERGAPPVVNDPYLTQLAAAAAVAVLGPRSLSVGAVQLSGDGFGCYLEHVPGTVLQIGTGLPVGAVAEPDSGRDTAQRVADHGKHLLVQLAQSALTAPLP